MTLSSSELWAKVLERPRPHQKVDLPIYDAEGKSLGQVAVVTLTQEEQIVCSAETERFTRKTLKEIPKADEPRRGYDDVYNNQGACEILYRACRKPENLSEHFFPAPSAIRERFSPDEIGVLFRSYMIVQDEIGPIVSRMSEDEINALIRRLQEGGTRSPLASLSLAELIDLAFSLARRIQLSATSKSSPGSQPSDGSPSTADGDAVGDGVSTESTDTPKAE